MTAYPPSEDLTDALFKKISRYVYDHARINLTENKRELVRARIGKVIRTRGFKGYRDFYRYMVEDDTGEAMREVLNAVSTNLTSFFRESKHFDFLSQVLLSDLMARQQRGGARRLRGWSAGCSTGEEVYTIALTLAETIPDLHTWDAKLLASDIDTTVVNTGQQGIYHKKRLESVPKMLLSKYFTRLDGDDKDHYQVVPELRRYVAFRNLNLMQPWPFKRHFDFIFCRNVMIYFDNPTQEMLVNRFHEVLAPGGHLFIGHSEGLSGIRHSFKYIQPTIYRKAG